MSSTRKFEINYLYRNEPLAQIIERDEETLTQAQVAHYLMQLHQADNPDSLTTPAVDASEEALLQQAKTLGISDIRTSKLTRVRVPGHYQQP